MNTKVLILFAHPLLEKSRANRAMLDRLPRSERLTVRDLYECYPDFNIDIEAEKELVEQHDIIIWHHPLYWYSAPALLKQWIDLVLEYGWAYGPGGTALEGKIAFNAFTSGGARGVYCSAGYNRFTIGEFLRPFEQTACLCHMDYWPPFAIQGTHRLTDEALHEQAHQYGELIRRLLEGDFDAADLHGFEFTNDWMQQKEA